MIVSSAQSRSQLQFCNPAARFPDNKVWHSHFRNPKVLVNKIFVSPASAPRPRGSYFPPRSPGDPLAYNLDGAARGTQFSAFNISIAMAKTSHSASHSTLGLPCN
jgi:hypothetical protein